MAKPKVYFRNRIKMNNVDDIKFVGIHRVPQITLGKNEKLLQALRNKQFTVDHKQQFF